MDVSSHHEKAVITLVIDVGTVNLRIMLNDSLFLRSYMLLDVCVCVFA